MPDRVAVVIAAWNEVAVMPRLMERLRSQSRQPDEIVLADGGSTDGTVELASRLARDHGLNFSAIVVKGKIATGRNAAIRASSAEIIAVTDADCIPDLHWLERLTQPFQAADVVAVSGSYDVLARTALERAISVFSYVPQYKGRRFLPSHRSVAYRKRIWEAIGGYRDDIDSGEDTLFDLEVERLGGFSQAVDARVLWSPRSTIQQAIRQQLYYGGGDGQARIQVGYHAACGAFMLAELCALLPLPVPLVFGWSILAIAAATFLRKHVRIFGIKAFRDWPLVLVLLVILPPTRFVAFVAGACGLSVRRLLQRS